MHVRTSRDRLILELEIGAPVERVWAVLTSPEAIAAWWGDYVELNARAGGALRERWTDSSGRQVVTSGVVTRCEPPHSLELTWADADWSAATRVAFSLSNRGADRTLVRLEHSGWEAMPDSRRRQLMEAHTAGWRDHLASLRAHAEA